MLINVRRVYLKDGGLPRWPGPGKITGKKKTTTMNRSGPSVESQFPGGKMQEVRAVSPPPLCWSGQIWENSGRT